MSPRPRCPLQAGAELRAASEARDHSVTVSLLRAEPAPFRRIVTIAAKMAPTRVGRAFAVAASMFTLLLIILVLALIGGGLGHSRFGYAGWSPAGLILVVLLVLLLTGHRV